MQVINLRRFDYSFLKTGTIPAKYANLVGLIYSIRERSYSRIEEYPSAFRALEKIAKYQSIKSSNAIEGIVTSDARLRSIIDGIATPANHDEKEIVGYKEALNLIHTSNEELDFCQKDILMLHRIIFSQTGSERAGFYKQTNNLIIEIDSSGNRGIRFRPTSAKETPQAMEQLELAFMEARSESSINDLLLIPCVILDFLCIHPFADGNGRVSRLLTLLLLYKAGFNIGKYISFEAQIDKTKDYYYEDLRLSSINWEEHKNDYFPFMENFLSTLYQCYKELDDRFGIFSKKKASKANRVKAAIINRLTPVSKAELCDYLPDISPTTIESTLGKLVKNGEIQIIGSGRGTRYIRK